MTPEEQLANAEKQVRSIQVKADSLANPTKIPTLTPPVVETPPRTGTVDAVSRDIDQIVAADTEEARTLRQRRNEFAQLGELGTGAEFREQQLETFGVPESTRQFKDIQLQLADIDTASELTEARITGAAGQTLGQAGREVTQEQRENAVRRSGLAARAAVLQGSIETAVSLVNSAVDTFYKDRSLQNSNLIAQIDDLSGTVDDQTQQLLDQKKAETEAEQAAIQEVKDTVNAAMVSGASPQEVAQLTDVRATDEQRLALAQSIVARGATEERGLDIDAKQASIRSTNASAALNEQKLVDIEAKQEALDNAVANGEVVLTEDQADRASKLSKEFVTESAEFKKQVDAFNRIVASAEDPSAAGDVAVVFNFMKMLDPGSVVRESEFALAASTGSLEEAMKNKFGKHVTGEILEFTRDDFVDRSQKLYLQGLEQQVQLEENKRAQAIDLYGMPENAADLIIQDVRATGALSETVFGLTLNSMSDEQLAELAAEGLITE